jgi:hypothetical protein
MTKSIFTRLQQCFRRCCEASSVDDFPIKELLALLNEIRKYKPTSDDIDQLPYIRGQLPDLTLLYTGAVTAYHHFFSAARQAQIEIAVELSNALVKIAEHLSAQHEPRQEAHSKLISLTIKQLNRCLAQENFTDFFTVDTFGGSSEQDIKRISEQVVKNNELSKPAIQRLEKLKRLYEHYKKLYSNLCQLPRTMDFSLVLSSATTQLQTLKSRKVTNPEKLVGPALSNS